MKCMLANMDFILQLQVEAIPDGWFKLADVDAYTEP